MNILVINEENQYEALIEDIKSLPKAYVEVTNVDFDLTTSINRSQIIIILANDEIITKFKNQYSASLDQKLLVVTSAKIKNEAPLDVNAAFINGVGIFAIDSDYQIAPIINETLIKIFNKNLCVKICDKNEYDNQINNLRQLESDIIKVIAKYEKKLSHSELEQTLKSIKIK